MYLRNASLDQRPMSMIVKTGHSPKYIAMAAPDLIECVPIWSFVMPSRCSPIATTASRRALITCSDVTCVTLSLSKTAEMGVSAVVLL